MGAKSGMTPPELLALPVSIPLHTAAQAFGLGRTTAYELAKEGRFPTPVLKLGGQYRVNRADLLRVLGIDEGAAS